MWLRRLVKKEKQERRILRQIERTGDRLEPEYRRRTPECPHPERWRMFDSMTAEAEVLEFLRAVVTSSSPEVCGEAVPPGWTGVATVLIQLEPHGLGKLPLLLVEAVKEIRTQFERCRHVQQVGCAGAKLGCSL
jgi:hypothetical protein